MDDIMSSLNKISARLSEEGFLSNKGLSNEVGIHVFCYDPKDELTVRAYFAQLKEKPDVPYRIIERDLYNIFLQICEEKHILKTERVVRFQKQTSRISVPQPADADD